MLGSKKELHLTLDLHIVREEGLFLVPNSVDLSKHKMAQYRNLLRGLQSSSEKSKTFLCSFIFRCWYWLSCAKSWCSGLHPAWKCLCVHWRGIYFPQDWQAKWAMPWTQLPPFKPSNLILNLTNNGATALCLVQSTLERGGRSLVNNHMSHTEPDCVIHLSAQDSTSDVFPSSQPTGCSQATTTYHVLWDRSNRDLQSMKCSVYCQKLIFDIIWWAGWLSEEVNSPQKVMLSVNIW